MIVALKDARDVLYKIIWLWWEIAQACDRDDAESELENASTVWSLW